jgi:hypothetical protein
MRRIVVINGLMLDGVATRASAPATAGDRPA